ncbi:MAG: WD40/YVTN/BNR-like repeat-containing protein, partial [Thermoanaerobaculia bacterium]
APRPGSARILYVATAEDVYKSVDGGRSWTAVGHAGGVQGITHLLAVEPGRPNVVYTAGGTGVFRSQDAGATWTLLPGLPERAAVSALLVLRQGLFAGASAFNHPGGVFKSTDGGTTWAFSSRGIHALTLSFIRFGEPGTLWIVADFVLFRGTDQGLTWTPVHPDPDSTLPVVAVATDPSDRSNVFVLISDGALWRSHDEGETWEAGGHAEMQALDLEVDPQNPSTLYAAGYGRIAKSTDAGNTWTPLPVESAAFYYDLDVAPSSPSTLYAAGNDGDFNTFFLRSQDGGATWTRLSLSSRGLTPSALAVDPLVATTVYTAGGGFVMRSTDSGQTWSDISDVIDSNHVHPLEIAESGRLYAAMWNLGVYALDEGSPTLINLGGRFFDWIFTALAPDPRDPCRVYAGAQATSLMEFTYADCP